jgi:RHS repeat-associated protein
LINLIKIYFLHYKDRNIASNMKLYNPRPKSPKLAESLRYSSTIPAYDGLQKTHLHDTSTTVYNAHTPTTFYRLKTYTQHKKQTPAPTPPSTTNHLRNTTQTLPQRHKTIATKALRNTHAADQHGYWPSRDPIEEDGGINLYAFVYNSPYYWFDILGMDPTSYYSTEPFHPGMTSRHLRPFSPPRSVKGEFTFDVKDLADDVSVGTIVVAVEVFRTGQFRLDYAKLAASLKDKGLTEAAANAVRDKLKTEFRNKGPAMFKAWTAMVLRNRNATGHVTGRNNASKTNAKLNATAKVLKHSGRAVAAVGIGFEIVNIAQAPPNERGREAALAGGRVGGGFLGGAATGAGLGLAGFNPFTVAGGALIGGILGSIAGEGVVEACIEDE